MDLSGVDSNAGQGIAVSGYAPALVAQVKEQSDFVAWWGARR